MRGPIPPRSRPEPAAAAGVQAGGVSYLREFFSLISVRCGGGGTNIGWLTTVQASSPALPAEARKCKAEVAKPRGAIRPPLASARAGVRLRIAQQARVNAAFERLAARSSADIRGTNTESHLCLRNAWLDPLHTRRPPISWRRATSPMPPPAYDGCGDRIALRAAPNRILRSMSPSFFEDITHFETAGFKGGPLSA
jgi:hypothetical protein